MSIVILLTTKAKEDQFQNLVATMKAILPDTAAWDGAELVRAAVNPVDKTVIVYEVWDKAENQKAYIEWRAERGDLDKLGGLLREPPTFESFDNLF